MSSEGIFDTVIKFEDKDITVSLKDGPDGLALKLSEKSAKGGRFVLTVPISGLDALKKAITEAQKVAKGFNGKAAAPAAAKPERQPREPREPREVREPREPREPRRTVNHSEPEVVSRSIYVSGLTWETTEDMLKDHFKRAGTILKTTILVRRRGRELVSRGCGVIEFKTAAEAQRAVHDFQETQLDGRPIKCREDRGDIAKDGGVAGVAAAASTVEVDGDKPKRGPRVTRERKPRSTEDKVLVPTKVFVANLNWETTSESLNNFLSAFGHVKSCEVLAAKSGRSLGHAVVEFAREASAKEAIERASGKDLDGRIITVKEYYSYDK